MNSITISLQPIKVGTERLGRSNVTQLDAEGVLILILIWGRKIIFLLLKLLQSMLQRIEERRNINLVGLLKFLNNLFRYNHELSINSKLILPSIYPLKAAAKKYFIRLYIEEASITSANTGIFNESHDNESHDNENKNFFKTSTSCTYVIKQKLDATICNIKRAETGALENLGSLKNLTKEINIFEATGKRNESLNSMYSELMTIKPTLIESERAFPKATYGEKFLHE